MSARKRQPAAKAGDAALIVLERSFLSIAAKQDAATAELKRLRRKTFGRQDSDAWPPGYVLGRAAWAPEQEAERLKKAGASGATEFARLARDMRAKARRLKAERAAAERKAGITTLERQSRAYVVHLGRLHNRIIEARPRTLAGAVVQLRHLLDRHLGIGASGSSPEDTPALYRIMRVIERHAGEAGRQLPPSSRVAQAEAL